MKVRWPVEIVGTGIRTGSRVMTNDDFAERLDTNDEWIQQRTGIRERRLTVENESTLQLARQASEGALERAGLAPSDIDLIICATITPEHVLPSTACELQAALGCGHVPAFDHVSACTGFTWAFLSASQYIHSGMANRVLVVGVDCMSRMTDYEDRGTSILFGDAAGAAILARTDDPERGVYAASMGADGSQAMSIWVPAGGSKEPATNRTVNERLHYIRMNGREVYRFAVTKMQQQMKQAIEDAGVTVDQIALVVPHQSNLRIIESACEKLGFPLSRVVINIDRYGNTSAASVPVAYHEAVTDGRIKPGDYVMLIAFGAGLTWGTALLRV